MKSFLLWFILSLRVLTGFAQPSNGDLRFSQLPKRWDEGLPLGNGMLGAILWQKDGALRMALDRADLWDQRPMKGLHRPEFRFSWVQQQVQKKDYRPVQEFFDVPYDTEPAPTKIPGAALEINMASWGDVQSAELMLRPALAKVKWVSGVEMQGFVSAVSDIGFFRITGIKQPVSLTLLPPAYEGAHTGAGDVVGGDNLARLGYKQGKVTRHSNSITYLQEGWNGFRYRVTVYWIRQGNAVEGAWRISSSPNTKGDLPVDTAYLREALQQGFSKQLARHITWWDGYWKKSALSIPDTMLMRQWYLEQYKFGSASRRGAPPVSLQAIWTADNDRIPPWKGDYHHDLNTQLSYWPAYSANHLEEALSYLDHLDANKANYQRYTKLYFGVDGLNVPGVTTLDGTEMGGWIQYSLSPTVSCWLAQHYYWQWKYSMDRIFLEQRAYPWIRETARFIANITVRDAKGLRKLPISSSPEINDNSLQAWFSANTNYDLALMKYASGIAAELAAQLGKNDEHEEWKALYNSFGEYSLSPGKELMFAESLPYQVSHRHFSHLMAIHPLGLIRWEDGERNREIIRNSLKLLDSVGPSQWCGYSYAWQGNLKARAKDGEGAARALQIFASAFCSPNSFHLNGDQSGKGYSGFTYRPFTLEGNFAFAAGIQEMLVQSYAGFIELLPAIPAHWKELSFSGLRTEGAFLVDLRMKAGVIEHVVIEADANSALKLKLPAGEWKKRISGGSIRDLREENGYLSVYMQKGSTITLYK